VAALEDRIEQLETDLTQVKVDIKQVLVDLKELVLRDQNPLAGPTTAHPQEADDTPVIRLSP